MNIQILINMEVRRETGKFASRDEIIDAIIENIDSAAGETVYVGADGTSEYIVDDFTIEEHTPPPLQKQVDALAAALKPLAEWEFPPGVEQTFGPEWVSRWRKRAQDALRKAGKLDAALARHAEKEAR